MKSRSKILFFVLATIVILTLGVCGLMFYRTNITYFFIVEGLTLISIAIFCMLYVKLIKPYQLLTDSMELIKEQDFSIRLRSIPNSEANKLIEIFNKMMDQLRNERLNVREKNHFLDLLIQASPQGVIILDFENRVSTINPKALNLLKIDSTKEIEKKRFHEISNNSICEQLSKLENNGEYILRVGGVVKYKCTVSSFLDRGSSHPFILIEELTQELVNTEKQSYESIIRLIAHEVNNSVGAISSTLGVINEICEESKDEDILDLTPAVTASYDRCLHLSTFVRNFADVVRIPEPSRKFTNLNRLVNNIVQLNHIELQKRNIEIELNLPTEDLNVYIDAIQFDQVIINIIKNAYEAIHQNGIISITIDTEKRILSIKNNGPVLSDTVREKLFTPFFTTKKQGQGIGLMFIREILLNHQCFFDFYSKKEWTIFDIHFTN